MAEAIILEFRDADPALYDAVNKLLGLDPKTGAGEWPDGLVSHVGAAHLDGSGITVFEVWDSREAQDAFMTSRLGGALAEAGAPEPSRVEWMSVIGSHVG